MKLLVFASILIFSFLSSCFNSKGDCVPIPIALQDSISVFKNIHLQKDSLNITIRMGEKLKIPLDNDSLEIEVLEINKFCLLGETSCDVETTVKLRIRKNNITNTFPYLDLGWGAGSKKTIYPLPECNYESYIPTVNYIIASSYTFNNLIFAIREITPYPISYDELKNMTENKLLYLHLTILNKCLK